jgi:hypothetical protein
MISTMNLEGLPARRRMLVTHQPAQDQSPCAYELARSTNYVATPETPKLGASPLELKEPPPSTVVHKHGSSPIHTVILRQAVFSDILSTCNRKTHFHPYYHHQPQLQQAASARSTI